MATQTDGLLSIAASADLSASVWCGVTVDANGRLALPAANGQIIGVLQNKPTALKKIGKVRIPGMGSCVAKAGGTVTAGDALKVDATGAFITASAGDVSNGYKVGVALESAVANDDFEIVLSPASGTVAVSGDETVTSGALVASKSWHHLSTTGAVAYTLPDGLYAGQVTYIDEITAAASPAGTLTITTPYSTEPATHVFRGKKALLGLVWLATGWHVFKKIRSGSLTLVIGTTLTAGEDMVSTYNASVTGTVTSATTKAIPDPMLAGEMIRVGCTVAAAIPVGDLDGTFIDVNGAAGTHLAINATTDNAVFISDGANWVNVLNTSMAIT